MDIEKTVIEYYDALAHDKTTVYLRNQLLAFARKSPEALEILTDLLDKHRADATKKWKAFQANENDKSVIKNSSRHSQEK